MAHVFILKVLSGLKVALIGWKRVRENSYPHQFWYVTISESMFQVNEEWTWYCKFFWYQSDIEFEI